MHRVRMLAFEFLMIIFSCHLVTAPPPATTAAALTVSECLDYLNDDANDPHDWLVSAAEEGGEIVLTCTEGYVPIGGVSTLEFCTLAADGISACAPPTMILLQRRSATSSAGFYCVSIDMQDRADDNLGPLTSLFAVPYADCDAVEDEFKFVYDSTLGLQGLYGYDGTTGYFLDRDNQNNAYIRLEPTLAGITIQWWFVRPSTYELRLAEGNSQNDKAWVLVDTVLHQISGAQENSVDNNHLINVYFANIYNSACSTDSECQAVLPNSVCNRSPPGSILPTGTGICECEAGKLFYNYACVLEDETPCFDKCDNGGTCFMVDNEAVCDCAAGYAGETCCISLTCASDTCANGGTCIDEFDSELCDPATTSCQCEVGYEGDTCADQNACFDVDCGSGSCYVEADNPFCKCDCNVGNAGDGAICSDVDVVDLGTPSITNSSFCTSVTVSYTRDTSTSNYINPAYIQNLGVDATPTYTLYYNTLLNYEKHGIAHPLEYTEDYSYSSDQSISASLTITGLIPDRDYVLFIPYDLPGRVDQCDFDLENPDWGKRVDFRTCKLMPQNAINNPSVIASVASREICSTYGPHKFTTGCKCFQCSIAEFVVETECSQSLDGCSPP